MNMLAELSTKEISEVRNPESFDEHMDVARRGGDVAREARLKLEGETGREIVTPLNAKDMLGIQAGDDTKDDEVDVQEGGIDE